MPFLGDAGHVLPVLLPQTFGAHADVPPHPAGSWARVAVPSGGGLAQLGEHYVRNGGVAGSTPVPSTKIIITRLKPVAPSESKRAGTGGLSKQKGQPLFLEAGPLLLDSSS